MKSKRTVLLFIGLLIFYITNGQSDFVILEGQSIVDQCATTFGVLPKTAKSTSLSNKEFSLVEKLIKESIENYNTQVKGGFKKYENREQLIKMYQIMKLKNYKIQYVPYFNENGEKEIWVNGFCGDLGLNWKEEIVYAFDGGNCIFSIRINLKTEECLAIGIHGYA